MSAATRLSSINFKARAGKTVTNPLFDGGLLSVVMGVCEGWLFQGPLDKEVSGALNDLSFAFCLEFKISCHELSF